MKVILISIQNNEEDSVFEMFNDIPKEENGFMNKLNGISRECFDLMIASFIEESVSKTEQSGKVPQTYYILFVDDVPVGFSKLRHFLTPSLLKHGGHIGYGLSPKYRGKGYAKILLLETLKKAKEMKIEKVLVTCNDNNCASYKTIEKCGGVLENIEEASRRYWIAVE
ncbi:MAG: GNAT family N-acetyltransferase [Alphaproteobacteria bacterium]